MTTPLIGVLSGALIGNDEAISWRTLQSITWLNSLATSLPGACHLSILTPNDSLSGQAPSQPTSNPAPAWYWGVRTPGCIGKIIFVGIFPESDVNLFQVFHALAITELARPEIDGRLTGFLLHREDR
jgi:hypothetical protein